MNILTTELTDMSPSVCTTMVQTSHGGFAEQNAVYYFIRRGL